MQHFPAFLDLRNRTVLVVGAGSVAYRKTTLLLEAGACVRVNAPELGEQLSELEKTAEIEVRLHIFVEAELDDVWLVIAATSDKHLNTRIAKLAEARRIWCNVVDEAVDGEQHASFIVPAVIDRAPITVAVSTSGHSPVLARIIKSQIEGLLSPSVGLLAEFAGRWRSRVKQQFESIIERRRFWVRALQGPIADSVLNSSPEEAERAMQRLLDEFGLEESAARPAGKAYIVGAGPGDPELISVRGRKLLEHADVVLYDRLAALELIKLARRDAELIYVGKQGHGKRTSQQEINQLLVERVGDGLNVVRLKGGDPMIFGRGGEELKALIKANLAFEVVPGITAALACAAYAGIPLTLRGLSQSVMLVTAHNQRGDLSLDWHGFVGSKQTLVFYMGVSRFDRIAANLIRAGMRSSMPCAIVSQGTTPAQQVRICTVDLLKDAPVDAELAPAVLIVGEVAQYAASQSWFAKSAVQQVS